MVTDSKVNFENDLRRVIRREGSKAISNRSAYGHTNRAKAHTTCESTNNAINLANNATKVANNAINLATGILVINEISPESSE